MTDAPSFPCYIVANWKMSLSTQQSIELSRALLREAAMLPIPDDLHTWVAPSFLAIPDTARALFGSRFKVGGKTSGLKPQVLLPERSRPFSSKRWVQASSSSVTPSAAF